MTSIRDIAKIAGVSPASVSRILNNDPTFHINEAARGRVIEIAKKLHYSKADKKPGPKQHDSTMILPFQLLQSCAMAICVNLMTPTF